MNQQQISRRNRKLAGHTKRELIDALEALTVDDDAIVVMVSDYGDISHTAQALPIGLVEEVGGQHIDEDAYSHSGYALIYKDEDEDDEDDEDETQFIILRS